MATKSYLGDDASGLFTVETESGTTFCVDVGAKTIRRPHGRRAPRHDEALILWRWTRCTPQCIAAHVARPLAADAPILVGTWRSVHPGA